jgi:hypothetical protein
MQELDESEIVGGELVVSGRDAPTLLDLVEEPLLSNIHPDIRFRGAKQT